MPFFFSLLLVFVPLNSRQRLQKRKQSSFAAHLFILFANQDLFVTLHRKSSEIESIKERCWNYGSFRAHWHSLHMAHANEEDEMSNERRIGDVTEARSHNNKDLAGCFLR